MFKHINIKAINKDEIVNTKESFVDDNEMKVIIDNSIEISFVCINENIPSLIYGYLSDIRRCDIKSISIVDNNVSVKTLLPKNKIIDILNQKNLVGICESIEITDSKVESSSIRVPFNDVRYKIESNVLLRLCDDFYDYISNKTMFYNSRIISLETMFYVDCKDTNQKTNIYKIIGMYNSDNLLKCLILLDFELTLEVLQKLIRVKSTFIIARKIPSFSIIRVAQKFGLTIGYFNDDAIKILSHNSRII